MTGHGAPVDLDDTLAVVGYGADALDMALEARLADALDHAPAAALVSRLEQLRVALQADSPHAARSSTGLFGKLLGRDVQAEAEAAQLRDRLGALLAAADRDAAALESRTAVQQALLGEIERATARIGARIGHGRQWLDAHPGAGAAQGPVVAPRDRLRQRLDQLATVQASWSIGAGQLTLLRDQSLDLLARYRRIRDVLLPAWRQQALGDAARAGSRHAARAGEAQAAIESEVAAMVGTLDPQPAPTQARE